MSKGNEIRRRQAVQSKQNPHVKDLTIGRDYATPFDSKPKRLGREERHRLEFHLRQNWALLLVQNMRDEQGWSWEGIERATGKTRQTWNNVCLSKCPTKADLTSDDEAVRQKARDGYRPVTDGFIRNVTEKLEGHNYNVFTGYFRNCFDLGLTVLSPRLQVNGVVSMRRDDVTEDRVWGAEINGVWKERTTKGGLTDTWLINRIGDEIHPPVYDEGYASGKQLISWLLRNEPTDFVFYVKSRNADGKVVPTYWEHGYPLLNTFNEDWGIHSCWEIHCLLEEEVFDWDGQSEPDPRAVEIHKHWKHQEEFKGVNIPEPPTPTDPNIFKDRPEKPKVTVEDVQRIMKDGGLDEERGNRWIESILKDDNRETKTVEMKVDPEMAQMGFLSPVALSFDAHPSWLDEDGEVEFKVVISFDKDGNKNGHMIKHKPRV